MKREMCLVPTGVKNTSKTTGGLSKDLKKDHENVHAKVTTSIQHGTANSRSDV